MIDDYRSDAAHINGGRSSSKLGCESTAVSGDHNGTRPFMNVGTCPRTSASRVTTKS